MCGGGGGGGQGTQQYNWNDTLAPMWKQQLNQGQTLSQTPYQQYQGDRIAPMNDDQQSAIDISRGVIDSGGTVATQAANQQATDTLNGNYLHSNPYDQMNQYAGNNPYFQNQMQTGMGDIAAAYQHGTAADTTRMFNAPGNWGGSAQQGAISRNEIGLGNSLSRYASDMQNQQYDRTAGMAENYLNRGSSDYNTARQQQLSAIAPGQNSQNLFFQGANQLMGLGDVQRGLSQDYLNQYYNDYQTQLQYPYQQADWMSGLMGRAQGGVSPNSTSQTSGYNASPFSQVLGAGLLGYGLTR